MQNNDINNNNTFGITNFLAPDTSSFSIDTGAPRNVYGHAISGAIAVGVVSGVINAKKVKEEQLDKQEAVRNTLKDSIIGGIASATAISVTNNLGDPQKSLLQTLGSLALGAGAVYAVEKAAKLQEETIAAQIEEK